MNNFPAKPLRRSAGSVESALLLFMPQDTELFSGDTLS